MPDLELVIFWLGRQKFGIEIELVKEFLRTGSFIEEDVELIDICRFFRLTSSIDKKKILSLRVEEKKVGLLVDDVSVLPIKENQMRPFSPFLRPKHFFGVGEIENELILLLDIEAVIKQTANSEYVIKSPSRTKKRNKSLPANVE